ncbi:hypothetical protein [Bordetella bronchiseptica]|uniref:hypothetical protein n=1 Tax=Bordetella bronchiseptica TaxID=518 RepID=UPI00046107E8|nr:hypothetical protein [Bordetella bronchiseptica]KDD09964.1 hypothetical protein L522_1791 [Bordetella bronchiseptica MBORD707]
MPKTLIKFTKPSGPYTIGDVAGFDTKAQAEPYIKAKVAEPYEVPKGSQGKKVEGA